MIGSTFIYQYLYIYSSDGHSSSASCKDACSVTSLIYSNHSNYLGQLGLVRGGGSRVEYCSVEKSNLLFAYTAALKVDIQQEMDLWKELLMGFRLV